MKTNDFLSRDSFYDHLVFFDRTYAICQKLAKFDR